MVLKFNCFHRNFTLKWKKKVSSWKNFERNLPLFQSSETINHGVEKESQMLVLSTLGLGQGKEVKSLKKKIVKS